MSEETIQSRQDNELEVLKSIYGEDLVAHHLNTVWKVWNPLDVSLKLNPLHNSNVPDVYCSITLRIKCCHNYPKRPPNISVETVQGISDERVEELLKQLNKIAEENCGEVIIFELAQHTQQFLFEHNTPSLSIYEEMIQENNEKEKLRLHDQHVKEQEELRKLKEEIQKRREMLRNAVKPAEKSTDKEKGASSEANSDEMGKGDGRALVCYADDMLSPIKRIPPTGNTDLPCDCNTKAMQMLRVAQKNNRKFYIGSCLGHSINRSITYPAIDDTGGHYIIKKWSIPAASDVDLRSRQMTSIHEDLKMMGRLDHSSMVPYIAIECPKEITRGTTKQCIYIFRELVMGVSLATFLKYKVNTFCDKKETLKLLRRVALSVFSALKELHSVNIVHRDVRCKNVFLDESGCVKLVGASLDARLADIADDENNCDRQTKAHDIYAAAQMLLAIVSQDHTMEIPHSLPSSAKDFFSRCLIDDEYSLWSAAKLVTHGFLVDSPALPPADKTDDSSEDDESAILNISLLSTVSGYSRIKEEFEILKWLGKGAFGDVFKVMNKLDGGIYAIKRVKLNPESTQLNDKIKREVSLLSNLNHENVVRYYNAWEESVKAVIEDDESDETEKKPGNSTGTKLGQEVKVKSIMDSAQKLDSNSDNEGEEDDEDPDPYFISNEESSCFIEFKEASKKAESDDSMDEVHMPVPKIYLYIQMEFCEKNTLRQAIDDNLYNDNGRAWRLFREIVGGLAHVHHQGMIHRDLKPVNIFLDSYDHVKLGDFGLATKVFSAIPIEDNKNKQPEDLTATLTGQVGTALYVAPELLQAVGRGMYNQKVDIYSLGIILFEMFHPPLATAMERIKLLKELRSPDIKLPDKFKNAPDQKHVYLIKWLLNHNPSLRPTCTELLKSEHVPRYVAEGAMSGLLAYTLSDTKSSRYRSLISACLSQKQDAALDFTFQNEMKSKHYDTLLPLKEVITKIFQSHGAQEFSPPLLTPRVNRWMKCEDAVRVMTSSGVVCHLARDLHLPFARYVAYSDTRYLRRYAFERVYRERSRAGEHPKEHNKCAFDIVTPIHDNLWYDAELLVVACRAAAQTNLSVAIQINHSELLRVLLLSFGVPREKHENIYGILNDFNTLQINNMQLQVHLQSLCISNEDYIALNRILEEVQVSVYELKNVVTQYVKQPQLIKVAMNAVNELEEFCKKTSALGLDMTIAADPLLCYNVMQHRGVFWTMTEIKTRACKRKSKKPKLTNIIASGGSYDLLLEEYWKVTRSAKELKSSEIKVHAVGFSMDLDLIADLVKKSKLTLSRPKILESNLICVCLSDPTGSPRDAKQVSRHCGLARGAWDRGQRACLWAGNDHDAHDHTKAPIELVLAQEEAHVMVSCYEHGTLIRKHKVLYKDVLDFAKKLSMESARSPEVSSRSISWSEDRNNPVMSINYVSSEEKMGKSNRRHHENQIDSQLSMFAQSVGLQGPSGGGWRTRVYVFVLAVSCEANLLRAIAANLTAPLKARTLPTQFGPVFQIFPKRQAIIKEILNQLQTMLNARENQYKSEDVQLYALYSIPDSVLRVII